MMDDEDPHVAAEDSGEGERAMDHWHQRRILERNDIEAIALHKAVRTGDMATVTQLLSAGVEVDARAYHHHSTPLMTAAAMDNSEMVRFLVYQGATVDAMDMEARDALDIAMHSSHVDCVRVLLEMGATVESRGMIPRLFRFGLLFQAHPSDLEIVRLLLKWGAGVNVEGPSGETPLARAVIFGAIELVMLLLNHGAAVNQAVTATGTTALHMAVSADRVTLSRLLVEAGADIYAVDAVGRMTPLQFAVHRGRNEIVAMLNAVTASKEERRRTWTEPWSIQRHHTFRPAARQRVYTLLIMGACLAKRFGGEAHAFMDVWKAHVLPDAMGTWGQWWEMPHA